MSSFASGHKAHSPQTDGLPVLRQFNRRQFLRLIADNRQMRRSELAEATGLTGAAVSRITRELISAGLVTEGTPLKQAGNPGRRSAYLSLNANGGVVLAITLSANRLQAALCRLDGTRIAAQDLEGAESLRPQHVVEHLIALGQSLLTDHTAPGTSPIAAGISAAMAAHDQVHNGRVDSTLLGWQNEPVVDAFSKAFRCPVTVESRPTGLLRAEINAGQLATSERTLLVNVGVGIGAASVFRGQIQSSAQGGMGSLAHLRHPASSAPCECGRTGCLQQCGSGVAVVRDLNLIPVDQSQPLSRYFAPLREAFERAAQGDVAAKHAFHNAGYHLAVGLDAAQALLEPQEIVLAGEAGRQADFVAGVLQGLTETDSPIPTDALRISQITSDQAAASIALDAHVFGERATLISDLRPNA